MEEKDIFISVTVVSFLALDPLSYNFFSVADIFSNSESFSKLSSIKKFRCLCFVIVIFNGCASSG